MGTRVEPLPDTPDATLRLSIVMSMVALGSTRGVAMPELLGLIGVTPDQFGDPDAQVSALAASRVLQRLEAALPNHAIALDLVAMIPPAAFGVLDLGAQSSATIGEAVDTYLRYTRLTSSHLHGWLERQPDAIAYRCRHLATLEALRHPVEAAIGLTLRALQRSGAEDDDFVEIHFGHAPVGPVERYRELFPCPVHFESFGHALVLRPELLARPAKHADPVIARSLRARLAAELSAGEDPLSRFRSEVAAHARPAQYNAAAIAKRLGRSLRTLQREAAQLGTTLSQVVDDLRVARARELLLDGSLSVDEVAFLVDYSERSAFSRAFKRATGETPVDWRQRQAGRA